MDLSAATLGSFVIGCVAIVLLPGANSLFVVTTAVRRGVAAGMRGVLGVIVGDTVLLVLAVLGASALAANPVLFTLLKWAGALYLVWLAIGLVRSAAARWRARLAGTREPPSRDDPVHSDTVPIELPGSEHVGGRGSPQTPARAFRTALVTSLLNPKAILFFASFFVQFIDPDSPSLVAQTLVLGLIMLVISATYLTTLVVVGSRLGARVQPHGWFAIVGTLVAAMAFVALAVRVVLP